MYLEGLRGQALDVMPVYRFSWGGFGKTLLVWCYFILNGFDPFLAENVDCSISFEMMTGGDILQGNKIGSIYNNFPKPGG